MQGKFIVFEGIDKSGKQTQAKMLLEYLRNNGIKAIYTEEPNPNNPIGILIKDWLNGKYEIESGEAITLLYVADRLEHLKKEILPSLEKGINVICDRYFYSTIAYESAIFNVSKDWIKQLHEKIKKPDVVIFIDIEPEISLKRKRERPDDRLEKVEILKKVRQVYLELADEEKFFVVNGDRSKEEIFEDIKKIVNKMLSI
ncbi:MAG: dTMP kinase [Candidatus Aenigmatarchaeota archaeon]